MRILSSNVRRCVCLYGALTLMASAAASATTIVCIDNATDLFNTLKAYSTAGASNGNDLTIELVRGITYKVGVATGDAPFTYSSTAATGDLVIEGGWNAGCTQLTPLPDTVIDGNNIAQVLKLDNDVNDIVLNYLTVQNGQTNDSRGGGIAVNTVVPHGGTVGMQDLIVRDNHSGTYGGGIAIFTVQTGQFMGVSTGLSHILLVNNSADLDYGAGFISAQNNSVGIQYSTVYGNTTASNDVGGLKIGDSPYVQSSIFWNNTNIGLQISGTASNFIYNDYGKLDGTTTGTATDVSVEPQFVAPGNGDFRLAGNSPLLGFISAFTCGIYETDLDGHAFGPAHKCEPGAYEDRIFADDLEGTQF